jgi:hypothetical protein
MVMTALALGRIVNRFENDKGHTGAQDTQGVPEAAHEHNVGHIPDPLEIKGKHTIASLMLR